MESSREKLISTILDNNNIKYEREKTFDGLKYKGKLRIDFYLTEHNSNRNIKFYNKSH